MSCPKCVGYFLQHYSLCETHQREYDAWLNATYVIDKKCSCGASEWVQGKMQMTDPPTLPLMKIWRCVKCNDPMFERNGANARFVVRE